MTWLGPQCPLGVFRPPLGKRHWTSRIKKPKTKLSNSKTTRLWHLNLSNYNGMQPGRFFWTRIPYWFLHVAVPKSAVFIRRRWLVGEAFWIAAGLGAVSPFFNAICFRWLQLPVVPFVFFPFLAGIVSLLYWRIERGLFRMDQSAMLETVVAGILWVVGAIGSGWCFYHHVCMCGHMEHPPYPSWHYALDAGWALAVLGAATWMCMLRLSFCICFTTLSTYLISYRFLFESFGGLYGWSGFAFPL